MIDYLQVESIQDSIQTSQEWASNMYTVKSDHARPLYSTLNASHSTKNRKASFSSKKKKKTWCGTQICEAAPELLKLHSHSIATKHLV